MTKVKKVWFDGEKVVTQNIPESDIYKRHWDIASWKAYAEQLRDKKRANTAEHAAEAIEYLLGLAQPEQEPVAFYVYKPTLPRGHLGNVSDGDLPWIYDQDPSSGYSARMLVYTSPPQRLKTEDHFVLRQAIWDTADVVTPPQRTQEKSK